MRKNIKCKFCGDLAEKKYNGYCQSCYKYFVLDGKRVYKTPNYGEIAYNEIGDCICPQCGMAYAKLGSHLYQKHHILAKDAYVRFGWDVSVKATNEKYREHMRNIQQPKTIEINLIECGKKTRYVKGNKGRTRDMISPMTMKKLEKHFIDSKNKKNKENKEGKEVQNNE